MKNIIYLDDLPQQEIIPGFKGKFIHSDSMTVSYWDIKKGSILPEHQHVHEQISQVIEGEFKLTINGNSKILKPGIAAVIPSNAIHSGEAITNCKVMDIFSPAREDYKI